MLTTPRAFLSVALLICAALAAFAPAQADACKCAPPSTSFLLPKDGATAVPTNARVVVTADRLGLDRWIGTDPSQLPDLALVARASLKAKAKAKARPPKPGTRIKARVSTMLAEGSGTVFVITPEQVLRADTSYDLVVWAKQPAARRPIASFTTGTLADLQPPAFAGLDRLTAIVAFHPPSSRCDGKPPFNQLVWAYGAAKDDLSAHDELVRLLYVQRKGEPRTLRLVEPTNVAAPRTRIDGTLCQPFHVTMVPGDEMCAILEVVDVAGNASGAVSERCMTARQF